MRSFLIFGLWSKDTEEEKKKKKSKYQYLDSETEKNYITVVKIFSNSMLQNAIGKDLSAPLAEMRLT